MSMEQPPLGPPVLEQLTLPLEILPPAPPTPPPQTVVPPTQVWSQLSPALRAACRQRLVQILQEVTNDARHR
jgi:hypothetical protein